MEQVIQVTGLCVVGALLALVVKRGSPETALLLAVMLVLLTACGAQKEYKLSAVFAAAEEDRPQWLADPDNAALWEQLGLSGSVVSDGDPAALTISPPRWRADP